jgi:basic membrane lipoprotein Med (substrate-binding protein (PBP1-ABC) superfamily)
MPRLTKSILLRDTRLLVANSPIAMPFPRSKSVEHNDNIGGFMSRAMKLLTLVVAFATLVVACGDDDDSATTAAPAATETTAAATETTAAAAETTAAATETTAAAADAPTELTMALVVASVVEEPWYASMLDAMSRAAEAAPHGLTIKHEYFEGIDYADGERVIRDLAISGKYGIILGHSTYSDAVAAVQDEFPDTLFAFSGSGNEPTGGNGYWIDMILHEPAYVAGVAAGLLSETNSIGAVAAFPFGNVTGPVNAFFDGALSVKPDIETQVTYIESWFDPARAREAAEALITAGADSLYSASTFGTFDAIGDDDRVFGVGDFTDQKALHPGAVITSTIALWDPALNTLIDAWWDHNANGVPMDGPMERILFLMPGGGGDIAPFNEDLVSAEIIEQVNAVREQIMSGEVVVELDEESRE